VQGAHPERLEVTIALVGAKPCPPVAIDDLPIVHLVLAHQHRHEFVGGTPAVERRDEGLAHRHRAIQRPAIAPALQRMGHGDMPAAMAGGLVGMGTQIGREGHRLQQPVHGEIGRRGVGHVAVQDQQGIHLARLDGRRKVGQRRAAKRHWLGILHGLAGIAQGMVDGVGQGMHRGGLMVARQHQRRTPVCLQILHQGVQPGFIQPPGQPGGLHLEPQATGQMTRHRLDSRRRQGQPVVGAGAGDGGAGFQHVEAVHRGVIGVDLAPCGERPGVAQPERSLTEKIAVQRDDDLGPIHPAAGLQRFAEGHLGALVDGPPVHRIVLVPAKLRKPALPQILDLAVQARRGEATGENRQPLALRGQHRPPTFAQFGEEAIIGADAVVQRHRLGTARVPQIQDTGLAQGIQGTEGGRVFGIALQAGGPAHVVLGQHPLGEAVVLHRGGEIQRLPRHHQLGFFHVGDDLLGRIALTAADPGQGHGRAHQLEKAPPIQRHLPERPEAGKLMIQEGPEPGRVGQLVQALPQGRPRTGGELLANLGQVQGWGIGGIEML